MTPILIALPYWQNDRSQALEICKIAAGLQVGHVGNVAHFLLVSRQDCPTDQRMIDVLAPKFNVFTHQSTSPLRGWPAGPNGMFASTMIHIGNVSANHYECVMWLEPDCVPIKPNWFWDLVIGWRSRHPTVLIMGARSDCHGDGTGDHCSGCSVYDPHIARRMPQLTMCDNLAWDYQHRAAMVQVCMNTKLVQNRYHQKGLPPGVIDEPGVVLVHGVKDDSIIRAVKNKFKIS